MSNPEAEKPAPIYMTPACARRLRAELKEILYQLRPEMVQTAVITSYSIHYTKLYDRPPSGSGSSPTDT